MHATSWTDPDGCEEQCRSTVQVQLQRLQNALAASRGDAERRDAAAKQAVVGRARAEADAAEARGRLRRSEERLAALRQQLAAACSALEAAGLTPPVAGAADTRACMVQHLPAKFVYTCACMQYTSQLCGHTWHAEVVMLNGLGTADRLCTWRRGGALCDVVVRSAKQCWAPS